MHLNETAATPMKTLPPPPPPSKLNHILDTCMYKWNYISETVGANALCKPVLIVGFV